MKIMSAEFVAWLFVRTPFVFITWPLGYLTLGSMKEVYRFWMHGWDR